jgi:hypothetical protein
MAKRLLMSRIATCIDLVFFIPAFGPGATASARAGDGSMITVAGTGTFVGVPASVTRLINAPPRFTGAEGVTVGDFTEKIHGRTLFQSNE